MSDMHLGAGIVEKTMSHLLPGKFDSLDARVMLLAIGAQESAFEHRSQIGGPARGYWQFEQGGGVHGVLRHPSTRLTAIAVCGMRAVAPTESDVYAALLSDDLLACVFARLLLWTNPDPLPRDDAGAAWDYYLRTWRPGKPHPGTWERNYTEANRAATITGR